MSERSSASTERSGATAGVAHVQEVLEARARILARPPQPQTAQAEGLRVLEFRLGPDRYAIEQRYVREVQALSDLTPLPSVPSFVRGIVNVRGQILAVIDLFELLELPRSAGTDERMLAIVQWNDVEFCILADAIVGVGSVTRATVQPSLPSLSGAAAKYLVGVTVEHVAILDIGRIAADPGFLVQDEG
ncbi:MAG TPA: chemotaxis protein CheW [Candidatus Limnocylindrales bacterium]|nr:chemotaxis protein CheW [Candidatus Limnocylindrales bacterium]